jgi:hypothetical protein
MELKLKEIWIQRDNGSRWKIIGMGSGYAYWSPDVNDIDDITSENDEGVTIECVTSRPPVKKDTEEEKFLQAVFGDEPTHEDGYIYEITRSEFIKNYRKEY